MSNAKPWRNGGNKWWGENGNNKVYLSMLLLKTDAINYCHCMSPVPKTINNLTWHLFLTAWLSIIKTGGGGENVERWLLDIKNFPDSCWICQISSISSTVLDEEFSLSTHVEHSLDFSYRCWIYIDFRTLSLQTRGQREGFFLLGAEGVVPSFDSVQLSALLFCTRIVLAGKRLMCCTTRYGLYQMMAVEAH